MKRYIYSVLVLAILACAVSLRAQDPVTLRLTGQDQNGQNVQLSRVLVENITKHWQEVLYYPDTTLILETTGIGEIEQADKGVRLFQNVPNPFNGVTDFVLYIPEPSDVLLEICDLNGKKKAAYQGSLDQGCHQFKAWLSAPQTCLLQARTDNGSVQIKMVNTGRAGQNRMEYLGKASVPDAGKADKGSTNQPFSYGDVMLYRGFAHLADMDFECVPVEQPQYSSELIPLTFTLPLPTVITEAASDVTYTEARLNGIAMGHPDCPVTERGFQLADNNQLTGAVEYAAGSGNGSFHYTVSNLQASTYYYYRAYVRTAIGITYGVTQSFASTPPFYCGIDSLTDYDGNTYATVGIGSQCWMKENLRTTHYADGVEIPDGTDFALSMYNPYRYCPSGDSLNIPVLGYLYNWPAVMHGSATSSANPSGVQGICPFGWHVPSQGEFNQLVSYLGSQPQYVCGENNSNVAKSLAATTGWQSSDSYCAAGNNPETNNATGFTAFPSGIYYDGNYSDAETSSYFWSATQNVLAGNYGAYRLWIQVNDPNVIISGILQCSGQPVRCLHD